MSDLIKSSGRLLRVVSARINCACIIDNLYNLIDAESVVVVVVRRIAHTNTVIGLSRALTASARLNAVPDVQIVWYFFL